MWEWRKQSVLLHISKVDIKISNFSIFSLDWAIYLFIFYLFTYLLTVVYPMYCLAVSWPSTFQPINASILLLSLPYLPSFVPMENVSRPCHLSLREQMILLRIPTIQEALRSDFGMMSQLPFSTVTNYHKLSGINPHGFIFFIVLELGCSKCSSWAML